MINQKLQDFEEDVKALGDLMTQVIDFAHNYTGLALSYLWLKKIGKITEIVYIFVFLFRQPLISTTPSLPECFRLLPRYITFLT